MSKHDRSLQNTAGNDPGRTRTDRLPDSTPHDKIAVLAYEFWQRRGCPIGTPDEDWTRAEATLQHRQIRRFEG